MQHNVLPHEHAHAHAREVEAVQKLSVREHCVVREDILVREHILVGEHILGRSGPKIACRCVCVCIYILVIVNSKRTHSSRGTHSR